MGNLMAIVVLKRLKKEVNKLEMGEANHKRNELAIKFKSFIL